MRTLAATVIGALAPFIPVASRGPVRMTAHHPVHGHARRMVAELDAPVTLTLAAPATISGSVVDAVGQAVLDHELAADGPSGGRRVHVRAFEEFL